MQAESSKATVAVGMSGGTDSSAAAALLVAQGLRVIGLTALMTKAPSKCCSDEDVRRSRQHAERLGIPHYVIDVHETFEQAIVAPFVRTYLAGATPSPCVRCNERIKFGVLLEKALQLGAGKLATGHYARTEQAADGTWKLLRGCDAAKDQSYFLARLTQGRLRHVLFPLGTRTKAEARRMVTENGLNSRTSRESQDLCFVGYAGHAAWIDAQLEKGRYTPAGTAPAPGRIVDTAGREIGRHDGLHHYTVGQRKGLGVAAGYPVFVVRLDRERNEVVVGERSEAFGRSLVARDLNWIAGAAPRGPLRVQTQIRYNHMPADSVLSVADDGRATVTFDLPQFAVTPGQNVVFYDGDEVLGAGWIA